MMTSERWRPQPGDRVQHRFAGVGTVVTINRRSAWVQWDNGHKGGALTVDLRRPEAPTDKGRST